MPTPHLTFAPRTPADDARELETAVALATHQCAALAAGIEATVSEAIARLEQAIDKAMADVEARLERLGG